VFFNLVSPGLKADILRHINQKLVDNTSVFRNCNDVQIQAFLNHLKNQLCVEGDTILHQFYDPKAMYLIHKGVVSVRREPGLGGESKEIK
jgi:hypothetical protein